MKPRAFVAAVFVVGISSILRAQPVPSLSSPAPVSILRGQTVEIPLKGASLQTAGAVLLPEDSGLTARLAKSEKPDGSEARLTVIAAADAPPGMRELRLGSPTGVSNPVQVWVEQFPLVLEKEPH